MSVRPGDNMEKKKNHKSESSKKAILDAALILVRQKGFPKTSIRDICKAAGLSIGAFYHHFPSKDALMNEAFLYFDRTLMEDGAKKYAALPPIAALKAVLLDQSAFTANEGYQVITEYYRALLQNETRGAVSPERQYYKAVHAQVERAQAAGALSSAVPAEELAELLIKFVRGNLVDWCLHNGDYDAPARTSRELDLVLDAL